MASPITQLSAPGLSEEQLQAEKAWLQKFNQASDSLDWTRWEKWWDSGRYNSRILYSAQVAYYVIRIDAFLQFGNQRVEGKKAIANFFQEQLGFLDLMHHR
jgi:hypothetical protein